jgi:hypothetical protein
VLPSSFFVYMQVVQALFTVSNLVFLTFFRNEVFEVKLLII